jgi:hypothetical protein
MRKRDTIDPPLVSNDGRSRIVVQTHCAKQADVDHRQGQTDDLRGGSNRHSFVSSLGAHGTPFNFDHFPAAS